MAQPVVSRLGRGAVGLDYGCGPVEGMKAALSGKEFIVDSYDPFFFPTRTLPKNHYDFLLCCEAAEHFFHPGREFRRMHQLLKPGGIIGIKSQLAVGREDFALWSYRRDPTHVVFYSEESVRWIGARFGWNLLHLDNSLWVFQLSSGGRNRA
jgi:hypothetical protein